MFKMVVTIKFSIDRESFFCLFAIVTQKSFVKDRNYVKAVRWRCFLSPGKRNKTRLALGGEPDTLR
jgi:hypothetical protein